MPSGAGFTPTRLMTPHQGTDADEEIVLPPSTTQKSARRQAGEHGYTPDRSETKKPRSAVRDEPRRPRPLELIRRGDICTVVQPHTRFPDKRWQIFESPRDCVLCIRIGAVRMRDKKAGDSRPVRKATRHGCPHLYCRQFAICTDHWPYWKHEDEKSKTD